MEKSISVSNECGSQWLWFIAILEVTKNGEQSSQNWYQSSQNWYESLMVIRNSVWRKIGNKHDIKTIRVSQLCMESSLFLRSNILAKWIDGKTPLII